MSGDGIVGLLAEAGALANAGFRLVAVGAEKKPAHPAGFMKRSAAEATNHALAKIRTGSVTGLRIELGERGARPNSSGTGYLVPLALEWEGKTAEHPDWASRWLEAIDLAGVGDLIEKLNAGVVQSTPSGGKRWFFEVEAENPQELMTSISSVAAQWVKPGAAGTAMVMAELLTNNAIVAPSFGRTHPSGRPYEKITGSLLTDLPRLDVADVDVLAFVLEHLSDEGVAGGSARETVSNLSPRARQVRQAFARGNGSPQASLDLLIGHGWRVLAGSLPGEVALVRPGSSSTKAHAFVGGPDRAAGQVSMFSTSVPNLPAGRHTAFDLVAHLEFAGDADKTATSLMASTALPALVLRAVERPVVDVGATADTITAVQEVVTAVGRARSSHDPGSPLALRQVASNGALVGVLIPQRGLAPSWVTERSAGSLMLRCAQPATGFREVERAGGVEHEPITTHSFPEGVRSMAWQELQASGSLATIEILASEPVLLRSGRVVAEPGFHRTDRVLLSMPARERAWWADGYQVPSNPTREDAQAAADFLLDELLVDFPFVDDGDRATALACLLTAVAPYLATTRPGFAAVAPDRGTGKSLLWEVIRLIASGSSAAIEVSPFTKYDEESKKVVAAGILAGLRFVGADNVPTGSTVTSTFATTVITKPDGAESIRMLGGNDQVAVSGLLWLWGGNSIAFGGDLQRRVLAVDLEVQSGLAFERTGFRHPELIRWVRENRPRLLAACHTILAFGLAHQPASVEDLPFRLASFEEWTRSVVGSLAQVTIGGENVAGLLSVGRKEFVDANDAEADEWAEFLAWLADHAGEGTPGLTAGQIADLLDPPDSPIRPAVDLPDRLDDVLRHSSRTGRPRKASSVLRTVARRKVPAGDRIFKLLEVAPAGGSSKKSALWRVEVQSRTAGTSAPASSSGGWPVAVDPSEVF